METRIHPETESRLQELANSTGRAPDELIEDAMASYLTEVGRLREALDNRYDDLKSGRVTPVDGGQPFARTRYNSRMQKWHR